MSGANMRRLWGGVAWKSMAASIYFQRLRSKQIWRSSLEEAIRWQRAVLLWFYWFCAMWFILIREGVRIKTSSRKEKKDSEGKKRGQLCGGHILQRHIYYFTTAPGKAAALWLCWTRSTNDNHGGNAVKTGEWASNVQGETGTFFFSFVPISKLYSPCTVPN